MLKFYRCKHCGNLVVMVDDRKVNPFCCGEKMELIIPASVDAAKEKHVPDYKISPGDQLMPRMRKKIKTSDRSAFP